MRRLRRLRNIWFRLALAVGTLLGVMLLVQAVSNYYQVTQTLVITELEQDARRRVATLQREARLGNFEDMSQLRRALQENRKDAPGAIAWIKVIDITNQILLQDGSPVGPPLTADQLRSNLRTGAAFSDIRYTPGGKVMVTALTAQFAIGQPAVQTGPPVGPSTGLSASGGPTLFFVEIALYWDSATQAFGRLRRNLLITSSAALGLVATMIFLWFRLPYFVRGMQLQHETEMARQVQLDMLPPLQTQFANLDFAAAYVPASQVAGDFYDAFPAGQGGVAIVLGDVAGKGLPAGVIAGLVLGAERASDWATGTAAHEAASRNLSEMLRIRTATDVFVSLFWCYYEPGQQTLRYVNAGHPPPLLLRNKNGCHAHADAEHLMEGGPVLGAVPAANYRQQTAAFCSGDLLVLYSDGVVEAADAEEQEFGEHRLLAAINECLERSCAEIRDEILKRVHAFAEGGQPKDDLTLVLVRVLQSA
jgi:hypothetical protein